MPGPGPAVVWFRRDLRIDDNPAWTAATLQGAVVACFVVDPVPWAGAGALRRDLLLAHLAALDSALRARGGGLVVRSGDPRIVVPAIAADCSASVVHVNADTSAYSGRRDSAVAAALSSSGTPLVTHWGNHVHRPGTVVAATTGRVHRVFTAFHRSWSGHDRDPWPEPAEAQVLGGPGGEDVPAPGAAPVMAGGEVAAAERLVAWLERVDDYDASRDRLDHDGTSRLSADLRWGTLAARHVADVVGDATPGRAGFLRQLAWRDWWSHLLGEHPDLADRPLDPVSSRMRWREDPDGLAAWQEGRTGYPVVDAAMRQLAATGWIHNRARMVAASFLVKDLLVDWRAGERHFRRLLVDGELSQNAGNWQWVAGTGPDAAPYHRVLNPVLQGRRFDPGARWIRRWVPELGDLPDEAVHAPWEAAPLELVSAGVTLGSDYPLPIVDHAQARSRALAARQEARLDISEEDR